MTFRFVLRVEKANAGGTAPVCLCISAGGRRAYYSTAIRLDPAAWDTIGERMPGNTDAAKLTNNTLSVIKAEAIAHMQALPAGQRSAVAVAAVLRGVAPVAAVCLLATAERVLAQHFAARNVSTYQNFARATRLLRAWHGAGTLAETGFDVEARKRFVGWLLIEHALDPASVRTYLSGLATLWARAGLMSERGRGPFAGIKLPRKVRRPRASLSREQLSALATGSLPALQHEARRLYLACFYLHGSRIGVVLQLRWADVREGRVFYQAAKGGPHKSVVISAPLRALLGEPGPADGFVFGYLPPGYFTADKPGQHRAIKRACATVNYHLRAACVALGLPDNIHPHTARHTMARMTVEATGGDIRAAQHVLGHSTYQQTEVYVRSMLTEEVDAAAASVYDSL
ncbi:tyrosine-type recombinase/integrase [Hymenobacter lapidiphilus]|uniref:Tyrosine-type recombinase/integrase n=1 Tax=Hymenobacter lapidiphilus TaxID=2608003 RepID=A0A7Y7PM14_9BACT|nr:tyrosine-type recombinase/integrase [Hymenobacter lapidiphilus]NVO30288.1 tyrosine-type recombinase/integrase [Hymenobacter lapidiphilus]